MIGYVTVGTNDLERAAKFYDAVAAELGTSRMMECSSSTGRPRTLNGLVGVPFKLIDMT